MALLAEFKLTTFYCVMLSRVQYCCGKSSVCLSVTLRYHRLKFFENNFIPNQPRVLSLYRPQHHRSTQKGTPQIFSQNRGSVDETRHSVVSYLQFHIYICFYAVNDYTGCSILATGTRLINSLEPETVEGSLCVGKNVLHCTVSF